MSSAGVVEYNVTIGYFIAPRWPVAILGINLGFRGIFPLRYTGCSNRISAL